MAGDRQDDQPAGANCTASWVASWNSLGPGPEQAFIDATSRSPRVDGPWTYRLYCSRSGPSITRAMRALGLASRPFGGGTSASARRARCGGTSTRPPLFVEPVVTFGEPDAADAAADLIRRIARGGPAVRSARRPASVGTWPALPRRPFEGLDGGLHDLGGSAPRRRSRAFVGAEALEQRERPPFDLGCRPRICPSCVR